MFIIIALFILLQQPRLITLFAQTQAYQIVNAQLLELQHHGAQVGAQDLRVRLLLQVLLEGPLLLSDMPAE